MVTVMVSKITFFEDTHFLINKFKLEVLQVRLPSVYKFIYIKSSSEKRINKNSNHVNLKKVLFRLYDNRSAVLNFIQNIIFSHNLTNNVDR
jgi:hypothetical protein